MKITVEIDQCMYRADMNSPLDISIPLRQGEDTVNCFHAPPADFSPVVVGNFVGAVQQGGPVNFFNIRLNPHGNGTHTECVGHIARKWYTINRCLKRFLFTAELITVEPRVMANGDHVIIREQLEETFSSQTEALIIRTLPNDDTKLTRHYSNTNPPYVDVVAINWLVEKGVRHLLIDLPSVDREEDDGQLLAHHAFWQYPDKPRLGCTITELIYVPEALQDGYYLLNLQIASFELDASPSKPVLYALSNI